MFHVVQSVPICLGLAAAGGAIEVLATAVLAYQDAQENKRNADGGYWSPTARHAALALNLILQLSSSVIGHLFAPWFGPVSLVGPVFLSAQLLANMIVFGILLGLERFSKDMQVGTYVVVIAVVLLPIVGPTAQENQDMATLLLHNWCALLWSAVLLVGMTVSCILIVVWNMSKLYEWHAILLLLAARATSFTVNLTVSKVLVMNVNAIVFAVALVLKITSGMVQTYAIVVQSTAVTQAKFVPLNASGLIIVNALTGLIVWQDWRVVGDWVGYVCVFLQLVLGNYLILGDNLELLSTENTHYGRAKSIVMVVKGPDGGGGGYGDPASYLSAIIEDQESSKEEDTNAVSALEEAALPKSKDYESITMPPSYQSDNGQQQQQQQQQQQEHVRRPRRRTSTAQEAWSSVYGLDTAQVSPRKNSIFRMSSGAGNTTII